MLRRVLNFTSKMAQTQSVRPVFNPLRATSALYASQKRYFAGGGGRPHPGEGLVLRNEGNGYFLDPEDVTRRFIKLIALHDKCKDPSQITLQSTFHELGLDELAVVEILVEAENEFYLEIPDDDLERMRTVEDVVEYVARSFFAQ